MRREPVERMQAEACDGSVTAAGRRRFDLVADLLEQRHRGDFDLVRAERSHVTAVVEDGRFAGRAELQAVDLDAGRGDAVRMGPIAGFLEIGSAGLNLGAIDDDREQRDAATKRTTGILLLHWTGILCLFDCVPFEGQ